MHICTRACIFFDFIGICIVKCTVFIFYALMLIQLDVSVMKSVVICKSSICTDDSEWLMWMKVCCHCMAALPHTSVTSVHTPAPIAAR